MSLTFEDKRQPVLGLLTNHHIVRSDSLPKHQAELMDQYGYGCRIQVPLCEIQFPARGDALHTGLAVEEKLRNVRGSIAEAKGRIEEYQMKYPGQSLPVSLQRLLDNDRLEARSLLAERGIVRRWPMKMGNILYSSGRTISPAAKIPIIVGPSKTAETSMTAGATNTSASLETQASHSMLID